MKKHHDKDDLSPTLKMLKLNAVVEKCQISRSTIYDKLNIKSKRYDPDFPIPRKLGSQSVAWLENEINHWLLTRPNTQGTDITFITS